MTAIHWLNPVSGNFTNGSDWAGGAPPGPGDDAVLDAAGMAFTVTVTSGETVAGLQTTANATLDITGAGTYFQMTAGTDGGVNAGTISVETGAMLALGAGTVQNSGLISAVPTGTGNVQIELLGGAGVTLSGGGVLLLGGSGADLFNPTQSVTPTLTNVDNTISGVGGIGQEPQTNLGPLNLINESAGVIDASSAGGALLFWPGTVSNAGLLESTNGSDLAFVGASISQSKTGLVSVAAGSRVYLQNALIAGGVVTVANTGTLEVVAQSPATSTLDNVAIDNAGVILVGGSLAAQGTIDNSGAIALAGPGAYVKIGVANLTLDGGGTMRDSSPSYEFIFSGQSSGVKLINVNNTISGAHTNIQYGVNFDNQSGGVVIGGGDINGSITNEGLIDATYSLGMGSILNTGTIE